MGLDASTIAVVAVRRHVVTGEIRGAWSRSVLKATYEVVVMPAPLFCFARDAEREREQPIGMNDVTSGVRIARSMSPKTAMLAPTATARSSAVASVVTGRRDQAADGSRQHPHAYDQSWDPCFTFS